MHNCFRFSNFWCFDLSWNFLWIFFSHRSFNWRREAICLSFRSNLFQSWSSHYPTFGICSARHVVHVAESLLYFNSPLWLGVSFGNFGTKVDSFSVSDSFLFLFLDFVLYLVVGIYLSNVLPTTHGVAKKWNFFCKLSLSSFGIKLKSSVMADPIVAEVSELQNIYESSCRNWTAPDIPIIDIPHHSKKQHSYPEALMVAP